MLAVTTKHIYYSGDTRSFRINFSKIVAVEYDQIGIRVTRDRVSAQPEYFCLIMRMSRSLMT